MHFCIEFNIEWPIQVPTRPGGETPCNDQKCPAITIRASLNRSGEQLGYGSLRILLSLDVASNIDKHLRRSNHSDLSVGINPWRTFGDIYPHSLQVNCNVIRQYDLMNAGATSPPLQKIQLI